MPLTNQKERSKALYGACVGRDWEAVIALCRCEAKSKGTANFKTPYKGDYGRTCLHDAVRYGAPCRVIRAIIDAHKDCSVRITRRTDKGKKTALHFAAQTFGYRHDAALLQILIESDPHCATMRDKDGCTPLHHITANCPRENDEERAIRVACVRALLNASTTKSILSRDLYKQTALHTACSFSGIAPEVVKMILEHCPQAALEKDNNGDTPLHCVALNHCNEDLSCAKIMLLFESLTTQGQLGAAVWNNNGQIPLHFAMSCADKNAIKLFINSYPESVWIKDKDGMTPLDWAQEVFARRVRVQWRDKGKEVCYRPGFRSLFKDLCEKCNLLVEAMLFVQYRHKRVTGEKSLWMTTEQESGTDEECLEHALIHNYLRLGPECPLDFFIVLKELHPLQIQMKDARGDLPLHIALENGVQNAKLIISYLFLSRKTFDINSNTIIKELVDAYPQAARVPNRNGDLPFHILLQNKDSETEWYCSMHTLLRAHPAALWHERTNLLPVLLPLILEKLGDNYDLSALYEIVREMPSLCSGESETTTLVS